jgi:hypothetical protein
MRFLIAKFIKAHEKKPAVVRSASAATLFILADTISEIRYRFQKQREQQQQIENEDEQITIQPPFNLTTHVQRISCLLLYMSLFTTPLSHRWYKLLDQKVTSSRITREIMKKLSSNKDLLIRGERAAVTLKKTILDQFVMNPLFLFGFFASRTLTDALCDQHFSISDLTNELSVRMHNDYSRIFVSGLALWPLVQYVTFSFVPLKFRVMFGSSVSFFWSLFTSNVAIQQRYRTEEPDM